jgi:hypothetical protein
MIKYEQMLNTMQSARDSCDETIRELQADITRTNLREDGAIYAALETGQPVEAELEERIRPYIAGVRNPWEATALAHFTGAVDARKYFKEPKLLADKVNATVRNIHLRTLNGLRTSIEETDDERQIAKRTGIPQHPASYIKVAYDGLQESGARLTVKAGEKELIKPTPAKVLLLKQNGTYIAEDFHTQFLGAVDLKVYQSVLTDEVQEMLLLGLFPQFFREEMPQEQVEEMVNNPLVSSAMPKFYEMAKEISAATKDKPSVWERFKSIWH